MATGGDDIRLTDKHLPSLFHQLEIYAHKWREIAMYLGFLPGEVRNIEGSLHPMQAGPKHVLQAILTEWFQWAPGDRRGSGSFATLQSLRNALGKAGLAAAACDLKVESNEAAAMGGASATGFLHTVGQPAVPTPSTHLHPDALPHPLNQAHIVQPSYGSSSGSHSTLGQPSRASPSTYPQAHAMPHPTNQVHGVPFQQPQYGGGPGNLYHPSMAGAVPLSTPPHLSSSHRYPPYTYGFPRSGLPMYPQAPRAHQVQQFPYYRYEPSPYEGFNPVLPLPVPDYGQMGHSTQLLQWMHAMQSQAAHQKRKEPPSSTPHPKEGQDEAIGFESYPRPKRHNDGSSQALLGQVPLSTSDLQHIDHWKEKLRDSYLAQESKTDAWPPLKIVSFVQLALVKQNYSQNRHVDLQTIEKDIDRVYGDKINVKFVDLFERIKDGDRILFEGRPGSGKTTLMIRVSCEWARNTIFKNKLVLLVKLRYLNKEGSIYLKDLLQVACSAFSTEDISGLSSYIEKRLGEGVVFILDGFDEYSHGSSDANFVSKLILEQVYSRSIVLVSSRPAATQRFRQHCSIWIEVVGFLKEQVLQYIDCYFGKDTENANNLKKHLEQHPNVMNLCYLPLHCAMLVFLYEEGVVLPNTEGEFYRDFTLSLLIRGKQKHNQDAKCCPMIKSFSDLPDSEKCILAKVCKLAFSATVKTQEVFKQSDVEEICLNDISGNHADNFGLVVIDRYFVIYGVEQTYTFLHLTLQEYLAAKYLADCSDSERTSLISEHCHKGHLYVTWRFLFGILEYSSERTVGTFKSLLKATRDNHLLHVLCCFEGHSNMCTDLLQFHKNDLKFINIISHSELSCVIYVLEKADYTSVDLQFEKCNFSVDDVVALLRGVGDHQLSLTFGGNETAVSSVFDALSVVTVPCLNKLSIGNLRSTILVLDNLSLRLDRVDLSNRELDKMFKCWSDLKELKISCTSCPPSLLEAINHCTNLETLLLWQLEIDASQAEILSESLKHTPKLNTLDLSFNTFGDVGLQSLSSVISTNCQHLKELQFKECDLTDVSLECLTLLIKQLKCLEMLYLRWNNFTDRGMEVLHEAERERNMRGDTTQLEIVYYPRKIY